MRRGVAMLKRRVDNFTRFIESASRPRQSLLDRILLRFRRQRPVVAEGRKAHLESR